MIRTQVLKHFPGARKERDVRRRAMDKGRSVGVIEGKEVRRDGPMEYFLPTGTEIPIESQSG